MRYISIDAQGYLLAAGKTVETDNYGSNFIFKYDYEADEVLWIRHFSIPTHSRFESIIQHPGNDNYLVGAMIHSAAFPYRGLLAELDVDSGEPLWQQQVEMEDMIAFRSLTTFEGEIYAGGACRMYGGLNKVRASIFRFKGDGPLVYSKFYMSSAPVSARTYIDKLIERDGLLHFFSRGDLYGSSSTAYSFQYGTVDPGSGNMLSGMDYQLVGGHSAALQNACIVPDGFLLFGSALYGTDRYSVLFKVDLEGQVVWSKRIGKANWNTQSGAVWFQNNFIYVLASTLNKDSENQDLLLVKLSPTGELGPNCICDWYHDLDLLSTELADSTIDLVCSAGDASYGFPDNSGNFEANLSLKETDYCEGPAVNAVHDLPEVAFGLFPNPAGESLTLDVAAIQEEVLAVELLNMIGQVVWSSSPPYPLDSQLEVQLDRNTFQPGLYLCRIHTRQGQVCRSFQVIR